MLVFTSCAGNYLPKALILARSVKQFHPNWRFCLLLAEPLPENVGMDRAVFDRILHFSELGIPNYESWAFQHNIVELCTAAKGFALNNFLEQDGEEKVIYLDPDILVLGSLEPLEQMLDQHDILLTPHQLAPQKTNQAIIDNEICSLRHGIFNLGFIAAANRKEGIAFSRFWRDRLADWCFDEKENGLFTDQKWCDLAPAYFPRLGIVRDPGCNAASWNLTDRTITKSGAGEFLANGRPLRFYHFTGHDSGMGQIMSSIYGAKMPAVAELWQLYDKLLLEAGQGKFKNLKWSGATFSNGQPVPSEARFTYRQTTRLRAMYPDPLLTDKSGRSGFAGWWRAHESQEKNRLYVWARKPFRLANLTRLYLSRNGGIAGIPALLAKVGNTWRNGGMSGLLAAIRKFKQNAASIPLSLNELLNPPSYWAQKLGGAFASGKGKLVIDHMYGGGANDYRNKRLQEFLSAGQPVLLLTWDFFGGSLKCEFHLPDGATIAASAKGIKDLLLFPQLKFKHILLNELVLWSNTGAKKDHYQAVPGLLKDILRQRERDQAFLEVAVHDYYSICPNYNLLENGTTYCNVSQDPARCHNCLSSSPFPVPNDFNILAWRKAWANTLVHADEIRVFSQASADILVRAFPQAEAKLRLVPHAPLGPLRKVALPSDSKPLRIGIPGHIDRHKGAAIVNELATLLDPDESLVVLGELEDNHGIQATGPYQRANLPALIEKEQVTACLVPSIWPETFCYVVQEVMAMQVPLVVFPLGAQAERVRHYPQGLIADDISAEAALKALRALNRRRQVPDEKAA